MCAPYEQSFPINSCIKIGKKKQKAKIIDEDIENQQLSIHD